MGDIAIQRLIDAIKKQVLQELSTVPIQVSILHKDAKLPTYAHVTDAGADIYATDTFEIAPWSTETLPTGLAVAIPVGYELQVRPRSGLSRKTRLRIANSPGTIDTGYRDEVGIIVDNNSPSPIGITKGDRIAQFVANRVVKAEWCVCNDVQKISGNRGGGFGSTGK